jgi:4-hydroxy-2-oxoheptanedioate aldolase
VPESLRAALVPRMRLVGTVLTLPGAAAAELLAEPFDLVWIDLEHGALGPLEAQDLILGAQAASAFALARIPAHAHGLMTVMLDAGADGVVLAGVHDPGQVHAAVERASHPPEGTRGWGPRRLASRRRGGGRPPEPSLWAQIEDAAGVACSGEIAAVPGIDALVVGTADLSFALGAPLDPEAPALLRAIESVRDACAAAGVAFGLAGALDRVPALALEGAGVLMHGTDARLCAGAVDDAAAWLRGITGPREEHPQR